MTTNLHQLAEIVVSNDLGPADAITAQRVDGDLTLITISLPARDPRRIHWLDRWFSMLDAPFSIVAGKAHATDDLLRLNVRGCLPGGGLVTVITPFSETNEPRHVAAIRAVTTGARPADPVDQLAALENLVGQLIALGSRTVA